MPSVSRVLSDGTDGEVRDVRAGTNSGSAQLAAVNNALSAGEGNAARYETSVPARTAGQRSLLR